LRDDRRLCRKRLLQLLKISFGRHLAGDKGHVISHDADLLPRDFGQPVGVRLRRLKTCSKDSLAARAAGLDPSAFITNILDGRVAKTLRTVF
jgi:hypothetical protein